MHLSLYRVILSAWGVLLVGTLGSSATFDYTLRTTNAPPINLNSSTGLWASLWLGGWLVGVIGLMLKPRHLDPRAAILGAVLGYWLAAAIRLLFLGVFLPSTSSEWAFFTSLLWPPTWPPYVVFWMLVMLGGALITTFGGLLIVIISLALPPLNLDNINRMTNNLSIHTDTFWGLFALMPISLSILIGIRNLSESSALTDLKLVNTVWMVLPQSNMIIAALLGFLIGLLYRCADRWSAALTLFTALAAHVIAALLIGEILAGFDLNYGGIRPNQVRAMPFMFFWLGAPLVGAIAAFALHNLRDAFSFSVMPDGLNDESIMPDGGATA